eukprot:TRINITY_DN8315_c0_g1_i9.p2 TRINITY_DN8315_c0_g1~~TRINITY_DN8315_c0_g1_i9.p2  ORF type:complete len:142 (-),score=32.39 TRINITY_DN8315_c0_g1_i9:192-617(-)
MRCLSDRDKVAVIGLGAPILKVGAVTTTLGFVLMLFGTLCHMDQFCWWYDGALLLLILGALLASPGTLGLAMVLCANGYGACQERRRQMLVEAGVKRYKQDTMERLDRIRRVPEEKDPLVEKELWPGGLAELECSDCDEEL